MEIFLKFVDDIIFTEIEKIVENRNITRLNLSDSTKLLQNF